ncbi:MAG: hypothetical protein ACYTXC_18390, partial [Nostoc sp.]
QFRKEQWKRGQSVLHTRDFQIKKYSTTYCGVGETPTPQDWVIYFLEVPKRKALYVCPLPVAR